MGILADAALSKGGEVLGVLPHPLSKREVAHPGLTKLYKVDSMHDRKAKMAELSDAFVILPGGAGTMEEFFEVWTWAQLGIHQKPCAFLNIGNYYSPLFTLIEHMVREEFLKPSYQKMLIIEEEPEKLLAHLPQYTPPPEKWI
jgi:uncharacterized protein (TIGR00730 family)